jgi:hypothetical protein
MKFLSNVKQNRRVTRGAFSALVASGAALMLALTSLTIVSGTVASAASTPHLGEAGPCNVTVSAGTGQVVGNFIVGVTGGSTKITLDCNTSSAAALAVEASLLSGVESFSVGLASQADTSALGTFAPSTTDTGCPAAAAGSCEVATFAVPATFSASDKNAACPPTQAEINDGIFGCVLAVATAQQAPVSGAEYSLSYASETTLPSAPTITPTVTSGPAGTSITVTDAAASAGYWWANAIQQSQALALGVAPLTSPSTCETGGGYGDVPTPLLKVNWFGAGSTTALSGSATGVAISNDCYDGKALFGPTLSGTIVVPSTVTNGTAYKVYLCELNVTPFPSNDTASATDCGAAPTGASWIDASFNFTAAPGTEQAALAVTSVTGSTGTALALTTSGGSGTGATTFSAVDGTATGCAVSGGSLTASSAGTCVVTATKAADSTYLSVSSTPTTVALAGAPVVKLAGSKVVLSSKATVLPIKISCSGAPCSGTLSASVKLFVRKSGHEVAETINFGTAHYSLAAGTSKSVSIRLGAASRSYLKANPAHPTINASIEITDNLGKKHNLGSVSLLK